MLGYFSNKRSFSKLLKRGTLVNIGIPDIKSRAFIANNQMSFIILCSPKNKRTLTKQLYRILSSVMKKVVQLENSYIIHNIIRLL